MLRVKRSKKLMWIILIAVIIIIAAIVTFFSIPNSKTKREFENEIKSLSSNITKDDSIFTEDDIKDLPTPVQKYFRYCGYIGTPKMSYMKASFKDVDFRMSSAKNKLVIDYTQYNFVTKPNRFAYIDSSIHGIPFEGFDSYLNGVGSMKGVIAKLITLFHQKGESMDKACLVTFLSECLMVPNVALQDYIAWENVDDTHAKATITYYSISASGIFTFDQNGAMLSFKTGDRVATDADGSTRVAEWSANCSNYQTVNGIKQPSLLQAIWHFPEGDFLYFNGDGVIFEFK